MDDKKCETLTKTDIAASLPLQRQLIRQFFEGRSFTAADLWTGHAHRARLYSFKVSHHHAARMYGVPYD